MAGVKPPLTVEQKRENERLRKQAWRDRKRAEQAAVVSGVTRLRSAPAVPDDDQGDVAGPASSRVPGPGELERAVGEELAELGDVATKRMPGMAKMAVAMARVLDNPAAIMQHSSAAGQLRSALQALHEAAKNEPGRAAGRVRALRSRHVG